MLRDLRQLEQPLFDVLVIGAGIYGATVAWDAALRGLTVALIDRGDFGAGTSFNNAKTLHGGVRSLQTGSLRELREYVRERRALMRIAPHLVQPLPFVIPTYRSPARSRLAVKLYFSCYDLLAWDRNQGLDPVLRLDASHLLSRDECLAHNPAVEGNGVTGGMQWHDGQMVSGERMTLAFVKSAAAAGAVVANYVSAVDWLTDARRVTGVRAEDQLSRERLDIRARLVINATGPLAGHLLAPLFGGQVVPLFRAHSLAMNLVLRRMPADAAAGGFARGRLFFLAPWRHATIAGTSHDPYHGDPQHVRVTPADVQRLLDDVNAAFPQARLAPGDVRLVHRGLLPAHEASDTRVALLKQSLIRDHRHDGREGVMSVVGVRYTTARHTAQRAVDAAIDILGLPPHPCRTATTPLLGGQIPDLAQFFRQADREGATVLARRYGTEYETVRSLAHARPDLATPLSPDCDALGAEVVFAIRHEMAMNLSDVILRRTDAGSAGAPPPLALERAATIAGEELGWSEERKLRELAEVGAAYRID